MMRLLTVVLVGCVGLADISLAVAWSQSATSPSALHSATDGTTSLPLIPKGKSTVLGGMILSVDPVRDEIRMRTFGQRSVSTIRFDERTRAYRDGDPFSLRQIAAGDRASVETILDGTRVFALSIHLLSQLPEGEFKGKVLDYHPDSRELTLSSAISRAPVKFLLAGDATAVRASQTGISSAHLDSSDLAGGALVSVKFVSNTDGRGIVSQVELLSSNGSAFVLAGTISALDMHSHSLVLVDPQDDSAYSVSFDSSRLPAAHTLHLGDHLSVAASYDGVRYHASDIAFH